MQLIGVDFTCAPTKRKPITVARGQAQGALEVGLHLGPCLGDGVGRVLG